MIYEGSLVYALSINIDGKPKLMSVKDHHLLSFNN